MNNAAGGASHSAGLHRNQFQRRLGPKYGKAKVRFFLLQLGGESKTAGKKKKGGNKVGNFKKRNGGRQGKQCFTNVRFIRKGGRLGLE